MDKQTEHELIRKYQTTGDMKARNEVVSNLRFMVRRIALSFKTRTYSTDELAAMGIFAVFRAVDDFDCSRGTRLSTLAFRRVYSQLARAIRNREKEWRLREKFYETPAKERHFEEEIEDADLLEYAASELTSREKEVLDWYYRGYNYTEIGRKLGITGQRVSKIFENIRFKMGYQILSK